MYTRRSLGLLCCPTGHGGARASAWAPSGGRGQSRCLPAESRPAGPGHCDQWRAPSFRVRVAPSSGLHHESAELEPDWPSLREFKLADAGPGSQPGQPDSMMMCLLKHVCLPAAGVRRDDRVELLRPVVRLLNLYYPLHWHWPR